MLWAAVQADSVSITRLGACDWSCADAGFTQLSCHQRLDKAVEACANRALADGEIYHIHSAQYRVEAQRSATPPPPQTGSATLRWTAPTLNDDGSPLTDLDGYRILWGTTDGGPYPNSVTLTDAAATTHVIENLEPGVYYFVARAVNAAGVESTDSNQASKEIP